VDGAGGGPWKSHSRNKKLVCSLSSASPALMGHHTLDMVQRYWILLETLVISRKFEWAEAQMYPFPVPLNGMHDAVQSADLGGSVRVDKTR